MAKSKLLSPAFKAIPIWNPDISITRSIPKYLLSANICEAFTRLGGEHKSQKGDASLLELLYTCLCALPFLNLPGLFPKWKVLPLLSAHPNLSLSPAIFVVQRHCSFFL